MSRWNSYLNTTKKIIEDYSGKIPLSVWLKDFYRQHKQMGANDRKAVSEMVYDFYRLGHSAKGMSSEERIFLGLFICSQSGNEILHHFRPEWNVTIQSSLDEKVKYGQLSQDISPDQHTKFQPGNIFPWQDQLSKGVDAELFNRSFIQQPDLFIRIRPGHENAVVKKLSEAGISFQVINDNCVALPNSTKIDTILELDKEVVVQDYNSQRVGEFFQLPTPDSRLPTLNSRLPTQIWDCCAASGGKSIMALDLNQAVQLTVSDVRESILLNLHRRFKQADITNYEAFVTDLSLPNLRPPSVSFDMIIADLPCTGSGTWARTPEQLYFFEPGNIYHYSELQKKIISNVIPCLKRGGRLVYITCSVFRQENEEIVNFVQNTFNLRLLKMELLKGYDLKADSMFIAVFERDV